MSRGLVDQAKFPFVL
jgi:hypothetical protein